MADAISNYMRSIPKGVKHVSHTPVMRHGVCIATKIKYTVNGVVIEKEIPVKSTKI